MKILLFSDLHSQRECLRKIEKAISLEKPDYAICCGDICQDDDVEYLNSLFETLKTLKDVFMIAGNNDGALTRKALFDSKFSSHLKSRKMSDYNVFGISDGDIEEPIDTNKISGSILLTHRPPAKQQFSTKLANAPLYHINGHLHSRFGAHKYPSTTHIQIPSLMSERFGLSMYGIFEPASGKTEFKKIN